MPIISGGVGNTTAQVVASGKVVPVADATAVTVDTATYDDTIKGSGKLATLVFPADQGAVAFAISGDAFPRMVFAADGADGLYLGNGSRDLVNDGNALAAILSGGSLCLNAANGILTNARTPTQAPALRQLSPYLTITAGGLSTLQLVSGVGAQILTPRDSETITPCTFNPGAATIATVTVDLSPDNVTYSTLGVETEPAGAAFDGTIHLVKVRVPAGWYLKLTANAQATLGLTTYY